MATILIDAFCADSDHFSFYYLTWNVTNNGGIWIRIIQAVGKEADHLTKICTALLGISNDGSVM